MLSLPTTGRGVCLITFCLTHMLLSYIKAKILALFLALFFVLNNCERDFSKTRQSLEWGCNKIAQVSGGLSLCSERDAPK